MKFKFNSKTLIRHLLMMVMTLFIVNSLFAQTKTITGKVTDADDASPLPGVNVFILGTSTGVITNMEGNYQITVSDDNRILVFSYIGYEKQEIPVSGRSNIDVQLMVESTALDELVVIGYGTVKKSDLTGSVGSIKADELTKISSVSPEQALQGKLSGVRVTSSSGAPGASPTVRIRGVGTFDNPDPIFVVDGVILDNINFLNSADIESIEVLKDASSTAMYGSRGANGVIMVTTKRGKIGEKTSINFSANYELQTIQKYIDMLDSREFATVINKLQPGFFNNLNALPNTDWQQLVYRDYAPTQNYQLSLSGGSERARYYAGIGYFNQEGIIPKSGYEKLSIKINTEYILSDRIRAGYNLAATPYKRQNAANIGASTLRAWPTDSAYNSTGGFYGNRGNGNPLASIEYNNSTSEGLRSVGNFYGEFDFLTYFTFRSSYGMDLEFSDGKSFTPVFFVTSQQSNDETSLSKSRYTKSEWQWENTIHFNFEQDKHFVDAVAGYTAEEYNDESINGSGKNLIRDYVQYLNNNLTDVLIGNSANQTSRTSVLFRTNYVFDGKYLFTATFRRDGSSRFQADNRYGNFPSLAAGWNINKEDFFNSNIISNFKIRTSWGIVGNDKVRWSERFTLVDNKGAVFGVNETYFPGSTYGKSGNPRLKWERAFQTDVGFEMGLWNNALTFELDLYNKLTKDILLSLPTQGYFGNGSFATTYFNAADVLNQGIELSLGFKNNVGDLFYEVNTVGTYTFNEAKKLGEGFDNSLLLGGLGNGQNVKRVALGQPIGYFYGYIVEGVFQNTDELDEYPHLPSQGVGDFRYKDVTGDNEITTDDRTFIGSPIPDLMLGLSLSFTYKGFYSDIDFQSEFGREIYDGKDAVRAGTYNFQDRIKDAWDGEGSSDTEPQVTAAGINYSQSDWFVFNGSFFRLRNITLGYNIPASTIKMLGIEKASIFLRGTNVFTLTKYPGYTPEIGGSVSGNGIDTGVYPVTSSYGIGLNLTF